MHPLLTEFVVYILPATATSGDTLDALFTGIV